MTDPVLPVIDDPADLTVLGRLLPARFKPGDDTFLAARAIQCGNASSTRLPSRRPIPQLSGRTVPLAEQI